MTARHVSEIERMVLSYFFKIEVSGPVSTLEKFVNEFLRFEERF